MSWSPSSSYINIPPKYSWRSTWYLGKQTENIYKPLSVGMSYILMLTYHINLNPFCIVKCICYWSSFPDLTCSGVTTFINKQLLYRARTMGGKSPNSLYIMFASIKIKMKVENCKPRFITWQAPWSAYHHCI